MNKYICLKCCPLFPPSAILLYRKTTFASHEAISQEFFPNPHLSFSPFPASVSIRWSKLSSSPITNLWSFLSQHIQMCIVIIALSLFPRVCKHFENMLFLMSVFFTRRHTGWLIIFSGKNEKYQLLKFPKASQINMPRRGSYFTPAPNYISVSPSLVNSITIHPVLQTKILLSQPQFLTLPLGLSSSDCSSAQNTFPLLAKFYLSLKEQLGWRFLCEALKKQTNIQANKQTPSVSL